MITVLNGDWPYLQHPNSFHKYNINVKDGIVYSDKKGEINIPEFVQKMMTENRPMPVCQRWRELI